MNNNITNIMDIFTQYNPYELTELCYIMSKYGSDKSILECNGHHNYTTLYSKLFEPIKNNTLRVFELGLGTNNINIPSNMGKDGKPGASLKGWRDFFPNSFIYGADIDIDILFSEDRIKTYYCNQLDSSVIKTMWNEPELQEDFDIIIEDGLHTFDANICFFENSIHKIRKGGVYIIEDIPIPLIYNYHKYFSNWKQMYPVYDFNIVILPGADKYDNNVILIKRNN